MVDDRDRDVVHRARPRVGEGGARLVDAVVGRCGRRASRAGRPCPCSNGIVGAEAQQRAPRARGRRSRSGCRRRGTRPAARAATSTPRPRARVVGDRVRSRSATPVPTLTAWPSASVGRQRERERAGDVADVDEVAGLLAVLEDQRRAAVEQARGEDRGHAGVRVGERLAGAVDVEEAQRDRRAARRPRRRRGRAPRGRAW